jgi:two-component system response regulator RegX3
VAEDGEAAVALATSEKFDLIVLDLLLPKLTGMDACRQIRSTSDVPIIMLTAKDSERDVVAGLEVGADEYVTKPFSAAVLIGRIHALLRRRQLDFAARPEEVRVGEVQLDLARCRAHVEGHPVSLTLSEFKILALLAGAPGTVYTRHEIMRHLWGSDFVGSAHSCEVHISALRSKIEHDPRSPRRLLTVRGAGYMLVPY